MGNECTHDCKDKHNRLRREILAKKHRREWQQIDLTAVVVMVVSFGALIAVDVTKGISLIACPLLVGFLVLRLNPSSATWYFVFFGTSFLLIIPIWIWLLIKSVKGEFTLAACLGVALLTLIVWAFNMPAQGRPRPEDRLSSDMANLAAISAALDIYRSARGVYPDRLSQLPAAGTDLRVFRSPRSMPDTELRQSGPLRLLWGKPDPRIYREIVSWSEVDGGHYLYLMPAPDAQSNAVTLATRPGLLYKNQINVLHVGGKRVTLSAEEWQNNIPVLGFSEKLGVAKEN